MQTHLLPLQPPYNYIYHGGIIGKQIATLVVTVDKTDSEGKYGIETHSHPVVVYNGQTAEGVVWDKSEVMDCRTVCSEADKRVTLSHFNDLLALTSDATVDYGNGVVCPVTSSNPNYLRSALRSAGIALELPREMNYYGMDQEGTVKNFRIKLFFDNGDGKYFAWSQLNGSPLYFNVETTERGEVLNQLRCQLHDWQMALEEFNVNIEFEVGSQEDVIDGCIEFDEDEAKSIVETLNKEAKQR